MSNKQKTREERGKRSFQLDLTLGDYQALQELAADLQIPMTMLVRQWVRQRLREDRSP